MITANISETKIAHATFLGGFSLTVDGQSISDQQNQMNKLWNILAYLIYNRERMVSQSEFIECFWSDEGGTAPVNALKTQLFRIRKMLEPLFGEGFRPILSYRGGYQWNPAIDSRLDLDEFVAIHERAHRLDTSLSKRVVLTQEALALYRGDIIPKLAQHAWVIEASNHYRAIYLSLVNGYADLLEKQNNFEPMVSVLLRATEIYPLEETLHTGIVRGLLRQERHTEALAHYEHATDLFYRSLGVQPWKELRDLYDQIMATEQLFEADLTVIQSDLGETVKKEGAFFCEYGSFREIYRLEARRAVRNATATHVVLLTVLNADGSIPSVKVVEKTMDQLKRAIVRSLRSGDVFTRYSSAQYLIMLPEASLEAAEHVVARISAKLWRYRTPKLKVSARVRELVYTTKPDPAAKYDDED